MTRIAIVTGASAGLGREFARQLDGDVDEIWLVARRADRLEEAAAELETSQGVVLAADLAKGEAVNAVVARLEAAEDTEVVWLINNAGFGRIGRFERLDLEGQLAMVDVNCRAVVALTGAVLPFVPAGGRIVQVSSSAAFMPLPGYAVYAATKAFVLFFGRALRAELDRREISVTVVCPGPVDTEFAQVAGVPEQVARSEAMARPDRVVRRALDDARRGRDVSVYGPAMRLWRRLAPIMPTRLAGDLGNRVLGWMLRR